MTQPRGALSLKAGLESQNRIESIGREKARVRERKEEGWESAGLDGACSSGSDGEGQLECQGLI